jgi:hypothetical protein
MDQAAEIGLVERSVKGEAINTRRILDALWRRCVKRYRNTHPDRFGEAEAYARSHGYREKRIFIALHCIEAEYNGTSTCERAAAALEVFRKHRQLPHSLLRIYETQVLRKP